MPDISNHVTGSMERELLASMNSRRTAEGLPELIMDNRICALASLRAEECTQAFSATRPDGRNWSSILADYGYDRWSHSAEIRIYASRGFPADILVDTWMSKASDKSIILSSDYSYCGIGVAYAGNTMYVVAIFAV